jgi:hypothetical protein
VAFVMYHEVTERAPQINNGEPVRYSTRTANAGGRSRSLGIEIQRRGSRWLRPDG